MIRKAMEKLKKTIKPDESEDSSIQERLDKMRRPVSDAPAEPRQSQPQSERRPTPSGNSGLPTADADEEFLRRFEEKLREKPGHAATTAEILREQAEDRRMRMSRSSVNGARPGAPPRPAPSQSSSDPTGDGLPHCGAVLHLSDGQVAIFHKDIPSRNYQIVHMVNADGALSSQGIYLSGYDYEQIGQLSPDALSEMQEALSWDRDVLVYHLNDFHSASLLPKSAPSAISKPALGGGHRPSSESFPAPRAPRPDQSVSPAPSLQRDADAPTESPVEAAPSEAGLVRGRRFKISMGRNRIWEAVYWGKDQQGTVIARNTGGKWTLMHLDLDRFASSLELNGQLEQDELRQVEKTLREQYS